MGLFGWVGVDSIFLFEKFELLFFFLCVHLLECPICIIVQDNQVSVADVKTRQMITGIFGIKDVFIDHICSASGLRRVSPEKTHTRQNIEESRYIAAHSTSVLKCHFQLMFNEYTQNCHHPLPYLCQLTGKFCTARRAGGLGNTAYESLN